MGWARRNLAVADVVVAVVIVVAASISEPT
jgi:hypothetical protein